MTAITVLLALILASLMALLGLFVWYWMELRTRLVDLALDTPDFSGIFASKRRSRAANSSPVARAKRILSDKASF